MFVRFRQQGYRLQASLMQSRRTVGKVRTEHVGALGSVDAEMSVRSRVAFWAKVHDRLAALGNRVSADEHPKILGALHGRIPMVTPEDIRAVQEESFAADERFWDGMRDMNASHIEGLREHVALAEAKIAAMEPEVAKAAEKVEIARSKREKLKRGEAVAGGLRKPFTREDAERIIREAGGDPEYAVRFHKICDALGFETVLKGVNAAHERAERAAIRRMYRLIAGARGSR
jgi:hypothetical protein